MHSVLFDVADVLSSLYFVGKGVTYDTGGADIKCSGHMRGELIYHDNVCGNPVMRRHVTR